MNAYLIRGESGRMLLERREVPVPAPSAGQVLVRLHAAGLNRGEFIASHGLHAAGEAPKPAGIEGAGEVIALGEGIDTVRLGDRVMGRCAGAFAQYGVMEARDAMTIPQGWPYEQAAAVPIVFMTVHDALIEQGRLAAGEWVLVTGVSSGVGVAALQTAKALGAMVIGTSGTQVKLDRLSALGLDIGVCTRSAEFFDAVMGATQGRGANLVVNIVGGSVFPECLRCAGFEGRLATVGYVDGVTRAEIDIDALHSRRLALYGVSNKLRNAQQRAAAVRGFAADLLPMLANGRLRPLVDRVFDFDRMQAAKAYMEANAHLGKIVVRIA